MSPRALLRRAPTRLCIHATRLSARVWRRPPPCRRHVTEPPPLHSPSYIRYTLAAYASLAPADSLAVSAQYPQRADLHGRPFAVLHRTTRRRTLAAPPPLSPCNAVIALTDSVSTASSTSCATIETTYPIPPAG
ncbi:hypothetical protein FB451DRAFT_1413170 [Mycena latifolia]|nr:hypothetical protein FB451DRAFT_1413170 [Mycena latifolia]